MELKSYQHKVLQDLEGYLQYLDRYKNTKTAFDTYWEDRIGPYNPLEGTGMQPYKNLIDGAPHVCIKVPTAGGKTFIACNALRTVFNHYPTTMPKAVVWLVPWSNLLDQTIDAFKNPDHPYRQKLNALFNHRVGVYSKADLLQGNNFNPTVVKEQLTIVIMSFASLRARNKEDRKVYQQNSALAPFASQYADNKVLLEDTDDTALINVIRSLNPLVVVDESHNAESDLSVDMLNGLNPSFVLDLTATPKANSNIVSLVPAIELKKEHMVKLPVIVYNHHDKTDVIESALHLQRKLEVLATQQHKAGGKYIRPIVLFQAQPRTAEDNTTFDKLKEQLLKIGIPEAEIKIKTANKDELKGENLMSEDCQVRYIITINALKEGWDCPFAYILASLADKSSAVDVEQILGRVLRQPYVAKHANPLLNVSYVLTASAKFQETLSGIVKGLQQSGFSENDYRATDQMPEETKQTAAADPLNSFLFPEQEADDQEEDIDTSRISLPALDETTGPAAPNATVAAITEMAETQNRELEAVIEQQKQQPADENIFEEMGEKVKRYKLVSGHKAVAGKIKLPQFFMEGPASMFDTSTVYLEQEPLLKGFTLKDENTKIDFASIESELHKIDLEEVQEGQYTPRITKIQDHSVKDPIIEYILARPLENQLKDVVHQLVGSIGNMFPIADQEIRAYVERVIGGFNTEQFRELLSRKETYARKIKDKIRALADQYAEQKFHELIELNKITLQEHWSFPQAIVPGMLGPAIGNSLYEREATMNQFEARIITDLSSLPNVVFWHRNLGRGKGFAINGFKSNHYPDFIIVTQAGHIILIETKGDDRDNSDSIAKCKLGKTWAKEAGKQYHYFMVFEHNAIKDAYNIEKAKELIRQL